MSTVNHHPESSMLVDFSAGNLATAPSICVSAHLHFCNQCRNELLRLDQVGSNLMSEVEPTEVGEHLFDSVMSQIDQLPESDTAEVSSTSDMADSRYPLLVNKLINGSESVPKWRRLSRWLDVAQVTTGQNEYEVALHKICAGERRHDIIMVVKNLLWCLKAAFLMSKLFIKKVISCPANQVTFTNH